MKFAEFKKAGHWPTLLAAFLYFDISFMAWVALGPLIVYIAPDMNLAVNEKFTLVAIPVALEEGGRYLLEVYRYLAETLVRAGRTSEAATLVEFAGRGVPDEDRVAAAYVMLARAAVATGEGDRRALDLYADAIDCLQRQLLPIEAADACMTFAAALRRFGEWDEAALQLAEAREAFARMGAHGPRARVDREEGRGAIRIHPAGHATLPAAELEHDPEWVPGERTCLQ